LVLGSVLAQARELAQALGLAQVRALAPHQGRCLALGLVVVPVEAAALVLVKVQEPLVLAVLLCPAFQAQERLAQAQA
jgi:hypothetical protein